MRFYLATILSIFIVAQVAHSADPPFFVKIISDQINPKTGKPFRKKVAGIRDSSEKCVNGFEEARANINKPHANSYEDADICGRLSFRADENTTVRIDLVNYKPGRKPTPTPTPPPTATPTRTPIPTPTRTPPASYYCFNKVPGWCWDKGPTCEYIGPCSCVRCSSLTPTPRPTSTPTPTPQPFSISRMWWPAINQNNLEEAYGHEFSETKYAKKEWYYGVPDRATDDIVKETIYLSKARNQKPRFFLAEVGSHWWCRSVMSSGGFFNNQGKLKTANELPDTLFNSKYNLEKRINDLIGWGVSPGRPLMISVWVFGCKNQMSKSELDFFASQLGVSIPSNYTFKPIRNNTWCEPDYQDELSVKLDAQCLDKFMSTLSQQYPEVGYVIPQLSNGCNAYGFDGKGLEMAKYITDILIKYNYEAAIQLEDRNCQETYTSEFWESPPYADCNALKAIVDTGAMVSLFWGWSYDQIKNGLAQCPK